MNSYDDLDIIDDDGHHRVADATLCKLAVEIEKAWALLVKGYSELAHPRIAKHHRKHIYAAAKLCHRSGHDATTFVRLQLEGMLCTQGKRAMVTPIRLRQQWWLGNEMFTKTNVDDKGKRELESEVEVVHARAAILGLENVIRDPSTPISVLTRVVLAWEADPKLLDIVQQYRWAAILEYKNSSIARDFFADCDLGFIHDNL